MQVKKLDVSIVLLIFGIIAALVAGFSIIKAQEYYNRLVPAVFAGQADIPQFAVIKDEDVEIVKIPKIIAERQKIITSKDQIVGKVASALIPAKTPIVENQLLEFERSKNILAANLSKLENPELVAYTIPANNNTCLGGKILPNDIVHIIGTIEPPTSNARNKDMVSKIIVPYAKVLDVVTGLNGKQVIMTGVTFALTPQQVLDVEYVRKSGTISFALLPYAYNMDVGEEITNDETFTARYLTVEGESEE